MSPVPMLPGREARAVALLELAHEAQAPARGQAAVGGERLELVARQPRHRAPEAGGEHLAQHAIDLDVEGRRGAAVEVGLGGAQALAHEAAGLAAATALGLLRELLAHATDQHRQPERARRQQQREQEQLRAVERRAVVARAGWAARAAGRISVGITFSTPAIGAPTPPHDRLAGAGPLGRDLHPQRHGLLRDVAAAAGSKYASSNAGIIVTPGRSGSSRYSMVLLPRDAARVVELHVDLGIVGSSSPRASAGAAARACAGCPAR